MVKCKITVLRKNYYREIADDYIAKKLKPYGPCDIFKKGQEFITDGFSGIPEGFCTWAWNDIYKSIIAFITNGDFGMWFENKNMFITCCTDGVRPVVFKIEKIEE